jgi:hypothetical protein
MSPARPVAVLVLLTALSHLASAQSPPAVRPVGRVERFTTDSLMSVSAAVALPGGRVLVNDAVARRLLLFDSTLAHSTVVADSTDATANAYGTRPGQLIAFRGDSALFIDAGSLSMFVIAPGGAIARVMAIPRPSEAFALVNTFFGVAGVDARGRLVYALGRGLSYAMLTVGAKISDMPPGPPGVREDFNQRADSGWIVRVDLGSHQLDSVAAFHIPRVARVVTTDPSGLITAFKMIPDPVPVVDDWVVRPDGAIAIVRGRDFHIDWIGADGRMSSTEKIPFDWHLLTEDEKRARIDSALAPIQRNIEMIVARRANILAGRGGGGAGRGGTGGRGGSNDAGTATPPRRTGPTEMIPIVATAPPLSELADYAPAFAMSATRADRDDNLWIRTTAMTGGQPIYDIVNAKGVLVDRVQLPPFRAIAGFGPGVVYLGVTDPSGAVHLERTRIK